MDEQQAVAPEGAEQEQSKTTPDADGTPQAQPEVTATAESQEEKPKRTFTQDEVDAFLAKERHKAERRAERFGYERAMREAAERQLQEQRAPREAQQPAGDGRPQPDQFKDWDSYQEALTDWKVDQRLRGIGEQARAARAQREAEAKAEEVRSRLAPAAEKYEDFAEVVMAADLPITETMAEAILELGGVGHDIAYHLGTHRSEAERISKLGRVEQLRELDKIAATFTKPAEPTRVPPPITPNKGSGSVEKRLEDADYDEFVKIRRKQIAAARGR